MRYLLGTLSDEERDRFEEMYFSDNAAFEEVEIAEGELVDRYVRGELSKSDQARFEAVVAGSPRLADRVEFARVWKDKLARASEARPVVSATETYKPSEAGASWWSRLFGSTAAPRFAVAFSVLLVLVGGLALLFGWLRVREESRRLQAQQAALEQRQRELDQQAADLKSQMEQLANRTPSPPPSESPRPVSVEVPSPIQSQPILAFTLSSGTIRGGNASEKRDFKISPGTIWVQISLRVADTSYPSYQATIFDVDRQSVFNSAGLKIKGDSSVGILTISVPPKRLPAGDYTISLLGRTPSGATEGVADYSFRIIK